MPQNSNTPYADSQPTANVLPTNPKPARPRRVWIAVLLGVFFGPLAQVYCGRLQRALALIVVDGLVRILAFSLFCYWASEPWTIAVPGMLVLGWVLFVPTDAAIIAARWRNAALKKYQRVWCYAVIGLGIVGWEYLFTFSLRREIVEAFHLPTRSMNLTLQPGDRFLVDKLWYRFAPLKRGDVAAFYSNGPGSSGYAHRVIGLPGDVVEIRNEKLYLNGSIQEEPYARFVGEMPPSVLATMNNMGPITVPEGQFFQMGDNRRRARDSRTTGCVPIAAIFGKVQIIYWSSGEEDPDEDPEPGRFELDRFSRLRLKQPSKTRIRWERIGLRPNG